MKSILLVCNDSNSVINFRKELIIFLISRGIAVHVFAGDDYREKEIKQLGAAFYCKKLKNRSLNLFQSMSFHNSLKKTIKSVNPSCVFTFSLKANILGLSAAHANAIENCYCMIEGLGDPFVGNSIFKKTLRAFISFLYRKTLKYSRKVFFLNNDDLNEFKRRKIVDLKKTIVIPGIGIDTKAFTMSSIIPNEKNVVQLSRLIKSKGIFDFCRVAEKIKSIRPDIKFKLFGQEDQIKEKDLKKYIENGIIEYCGFTKNIKDEIANARVVVSLSSYREGLPRIILESMALGRPVIATNVVGNKDAIIDGKTGFLLPPHDLDAFTYKILSIIDDEEVLQSLGKAARELCINRFDSNIINEIIFKNINL